MFNVTRIPIKSCLWRWIGAWFVILDCLIDNLTLMFLHCDFGEWWLDGHFEIRWGTPLPLKKRIKWWITNLEVMLLESITIVTFGRLVITPIY